MWEREKKIALLDSFGDCHLSAKSLKTECSFLNVRERLHCLDKVLVFDLCCAWGWIYVIHAWGWVLFCGTRQLISVMIGLEFWLIRNVPVTRLTVLPHRSHPIHAWGWVLFCGTCQLISVMIGLEFWLIRNVPVTRLTVLPHRSHSTTLAVVLISWQVFRVRFAHVHCCGSFATLILQLSVLQRPVIL